MRSILAACCVALACLSGCALYISDDSNNGGSGDPGCWFDNVHYATGVVFPAGDNCNTCSCDGQGSVACTARACPLPDAPGIDAGPVDASRYDAPPMRDAPSSVDASRDAPNACAPTGGCPQGPVCGNSCCAAGERCDNGTCRCGNGPACASGYSCAAGGPIGGDRCGFICCGPGQPCPL